MDSGGTTTKKTTRETGRPHRTRRISKRKRKRNG
jgi:hypothetical protein